MLTVLFLPSCTAFKVVKLVNSDKAIINNYSESIIPFSVEVNDILIKVRLNNSQKEYTFILDTGAMTLIRQEVARELGLTKGTEFQATGSSGTTKSIELATLDSIVVGDMGVRNCATCLTDISEIFSPDVAGILGSNFLRHFIVTIDYKRKAITLSREIRHTEVNSKKIEIPFEMNMKNSFAPEIACVIDGGIEGTAIIDTGFQGIASIPLPLAKQTKAFINGNALGAKGNIAGGIFGRSKETYAIRIDELKVGPSEFYNIPATTHHSKIDYLLLGKKFIEKYLVTIDYPAKNLILFPYGEQFETNIPSYGMALTKHNDRTVVAGIWNNSSASENGINIGNEIIKVNSTEADMLSLTDLWKMFFDEEMDTIEVEFINEKGRQKACLRKEMLLPSYN